MKWILIALVIQDGHRMHHKQFPMPSLEECNKAVAASKIDNCTGSKDCESAIALFCAGTNDHTQ